MTLWTIAHQAPLSLGFYRQEYWSGSLLLLLFNRSVVSDPLWPRGLQHARLSCPSPSSRAYSNSCPSSQWCHPTISSFVIPFSCLQSFPASESFLMSWLFTSSGQSIGASASAALLPMNIQDWFHLRVTGLRPLQSKGLSRVFSSTTVQKHQFFSTQPPLWSNFHIHTWLLEKWVAIPFSRQSSRPRDCTRVSCIVRWILYCLSHQGNWLTRTLKITYVDQITFLLDCVLV